MNTRTALNESGRRSGHLGSHLRILSRHMNTTASHVSGALVLAYRAEQERTARFLGRLRQSLLPLVLGSALVLTTAARASTVSATLEPSEISTGEAAQLTVSVQGQGEDVPRIPAVNGLTFQPIAQSSQIQIINGAMSASVTHTYAVIPSREGTFVIPEIKAGEAAGSGPLTLKVSRNGSATTRAPSGGRNVRPTPAGNSGDETEVAPDRNGFGFLRVVSPKKEFYVGETVPVELRAYFRAGADLRVDGLPQLNSDAFAMSKLSGDPARSRQVIDGVPYTIFSWPTIVTALKAGDYQLNVQLPVTVTVQQRVSRPRSGGNDPFGDSFFDDAFINNFFGVATHKQVVLTSEPDATRILPLPTENRPAHFAGAVGKFSFSAEAAPMKSIVGDPVTLKLKIGGSGNFDRIMAPELAAGDAWKAYKPGARFSPADETGFTGEKTFEQALVPVQAGRLEIPALEFQYFDPEKRQYATCRTESIPVAVAAASSAPVVAAPDRSAPAAGANAFTAATPIPAPRPVTPAVGVSRENIWRWLIHPWFVAGAVSSGMVFFALRFIGRRRRSSVDPSTVRATETHAAVAAQLEVMESAATRGSTADFFSAARRALQIRLGLIWNLPPQAITQTEIDSRPGSSADTVRSVFDVADEVAFSGRALTPAELWRWRDAVNGMLQTLEQL